MSHSIQEYKSPELDQLIIGTKEYAGEITIEVKGEHILEVCKIMKEGFGFDYLADISAIDYYTDEKRFGLAYNLVNLEAKKRIRILCRVDEGRAEVHSVHEVWTAAIWFERECWDMMGIRFRSHPDHRRLFMPEDFEYYPLRKEFSLIGIPGSIQVPEPAPPKEYK